ncbi:Gfo/Idh/MocA family protein [Pseudoponticoccus marisrubri]|uniref:Oxidoreductase n=1 Tax=Pseudoponticoccus marisrubri TaxID=1685382 RepID=A0A0W7WFX1_9RHOB|nr:Gfo/Idh/MocA family oxidoreductase [Pseudoponticoccus marisrubri]KUF09367.1 oxidoreductase [Pseudoponticoccus marisrubri]
MRDVAIIGAGIGAQHMAGFAALPDLFTVRTVCDLDTARAAEMAGDAAVTDDFAAVLADPQIDIVDICLPPHLHFQACIDALEAGKHVICEKPLVRSLREADALIATAEATGRQVFPVFQYRYGIGAAQLRALQAAGLAGRCYAGTLETHWDRPAAYYEIDWRGTWAGESGGAVLGHAIHIHDFLPAFLGPVAQVYADLATRVNKIEVEDCAALSIRMADGALITSSVTLGCAENISRMRLMFEGFTVESDHAPYAPAAKPWRFKARAPTTQAQIDAVLDDLGPEAAPWYPGLFRALSAALDGQGGQEVTLQDGRRSIEFVTAVYASARAGAPVTLPLGADHPLYDSWLP